MKNLMVINGPNLNLLGEREPEVYGDLSLKALEHSILKFAAGMNLEVKFKQSNHEGELIDFMHQERKWAQGIVINPGALTHYSYSLRDAISAVALPAIEVHLSDIHNREDFRKTSVIADVCQKQIFGLKEKSYFRAIEYLAGLSAIEELENSVSAETNRNQILKGAVKILKNRFPKYTWVGIYLTRGDELVLHNFIGKPSPQTVIPIGQGICGAAVQERQSIIVPDVNADPRYLACSIETRSEIVVPIMKGEEIFGEIDIDSNMADIFHEGDQEILEQCAAVLAELFV